MVDLKKIALLKEHILQAERSLSTAKILLSEALGETDLPAVDMKSMMHGLSDASQSETGKIVEGVFDGQNMIDKDERTYPVPANYASKSKLVTGDVLKLTITPEGRFLYKQIGPIERKYVVGPLTYDNGQYKILTKDRPYKVLTASVTYFKAEIGDEITLIVPQGKETEWGAVEAVLPKLEASVKSEGKQDDKEPKTDDLEGDDLDF